MTIWHGAVLGLVEGITEYLPISSTGHLILASALLGLDDPAIKSSVDAFNIVIQGGAILAVLGLYWPRVVQMLRGIAGKDANGLMLAVNLFVAFLPAAVLGVLLDDWIESRLFYAGPVIGALVVGGVFMILIDMWRAGRFGRPPRREIGLHDITIRQAFVIGLLQCVAMWPGTSRSMMTITGGMLVGLKPRQAAEFSFLLGLPTLGGATVYKLVKNLIESDKAGVPNMFEQLGWGVVIVGLAVATVSAGLAVRWLVGFLNRHGLSVFGWYRLVLSAVLVILLLTGVIERIEPDVVPPALPAPAGSP
jgi:undecaprenyl-diphosphatase